MRPKISVSPTDIRKIIMPIATPATVSVTQLGQSMSRKPISATAGRTR
jgi:hypothetical protein